MIKKKNLPCQKYIQLSYFEVELVNTNIGNICQTLITVKGQLELYENIIEYFKDLK